jgi:molybdopterin molybdotransferase
MAEVPYFVTLDEAVHIVKQYPLALDNENLALDDAHGRILARDLASKVNDPAFDNSAMDGFAMRFEDTTSPPTTLKITGLSQAGMDIKSSNVESGCAYRIMTGAPMPNGADSILQIELCDVDEQQQTVTLQEQSKKHFIRKKAENLQRGQVALTKGSLLTPSKIGLCATMGYGEVPVVSKAKVAIISTGDELIPPGQELQPGQLYESNSFGLAGLVKWLGHHPKRFNAVSDTIDELRDALDKAAQSCDVILTSGGVSMGDWDLVRKIMQEEGDLKFWRVKLRPGSPPLFGMWKGTPIFGLPGNPVSSHVVFRMIVAPWLRHSTSATGPIETKVRVKLADKVKSTEDCMTLRRIQIHSTEKGLIGTQPRHQGSGNLESLASADALTLLQPGQIGEVGEWIDALIL